MAQFDITKKEKVGILAEILKAVSDVPVVIRDEGKDIAVVLSPEAYATYEEDRKTRIKKLLKRMERMGEEAQAKGFTEEILLEILAADDDPVEKEHLTTERHTIFDKAHQRNSHLDFEATQDLIEKEVQAYRKSKKS